MIPLVRNPEWLRTLLSVDLLAPGTASRSLTIESMRRHHGVYLVQFHGIDRNAAEGLRNSEVRVPRNLLPELPAGEWYEFELLGMAVTTQSGESLGCIERVHFSERANDIWETSVAMIPAITQFVVSVDSARRTVVVIDDPGLRK